MILKNHVNVDKFMLESQKDRTEFVDYVTKNMKHELVEAMLNKIEPEKEYKIKLREREFYEDVNPVLCGYKMYLSFDECGWIPFSERMPASEAFVLVSGKLEGLTRIIISKGSDAIRYSDTFPGLAWMPLPEPWKGADNETD